MAKKNTKKNEKSKVASTPVTNATPVTTETVNEPEKGSTVKILNTGL